MFTGQTFRGAACRITERTIDRKGQHLFPADLQTGIYYGGIWHPVQRRRWAAVIKKSSVLRYRSKRMPAQPLPEFYVLFTDSANSQMPRKAVKKKKNAASGLIPEEYETDHPVYVKLTVSGDLRAACEDAEKETDREISAEKDWICRRSTKKARKCESLTAAAAGHSENLHLPGKEASIFHV